MDIISHGLWGSLTFGRCNRRNFWLAFLFGIAPDLLSFGLYLIGVWTGFFDHPDWSTGQRPDPSYIPLFVYTLYKYTHSLIIFLLIFLFVWMIRRVPFWPLAAWGLHILFDIPTHAKEFFPTPFLWPISDVSINGIPWSRPIIFFPNIFLLLVLFIWFFVTRYRCSGQNIKKVL